MSVQVRYRREAASFLASFVGAQGELLIDTTNNRVQVHDGATPGGFPAAKLSDITKNNYAATSYPASSNDSAQGYAVGSRWLVAGTGEMFVCRNATTGAAVWNRSDNADFFGYVVGRWYLPFGVSSTVNTGTAPGADLIKFFPWINKQRATLSALGVRVATATASAGGSMQAALYASNPTTKQPTGTALAATASMSTTAATAVNAAVSAQIDPGLYWFGVNCDNATAAFTSLTNTNLSAPQLIGSSAEVGALGLTTPVSFQYAQTFGTWPNLTSATLTEVTVNTQATPIVHFSIGSVP